MLEESLAKVLEPSQGFENIPQYKAKGKIRPTICLFCRHRVQFRLMKAILDALLVHDVCEGRMLPAYLELCRRGELARRIEEAYALLESCTLCPRECGVNRLADQRGFCRVGSEPKVASWNVHPWEEPPISGSRGSGTIFFSGCTGRCLFCQNYPISQLGVGNVVPVERLAEMMLELQAKG